MADGPAPTAKPCAPLVGELGVLCWLLKDAAWSVLCPYVSIPAALAAIVVETRCVVQRWPTLGRPQQRHTLAMLLWLLGNSIWMCGELLFAPSEGPGRAFPWFNAPLIASDAKANGTLLSAARVIFAAAILTCASCYPHYAMGLCRRCIKTSPEGADAGEDAPGAENDKVFGVIEPDVYGLLFIGPWIAKDLFWSFSSLWGALGCSAIVVLLIGDSLRRTWEVRNVAELLWVSGNTLWVTEELLLTDSFRGVRVLACAILLSGCLPLAGALTARGKERETETAGFSAPLFVEA